MPQPIAQPSDAAISKRLVLLLAFTCGAAAANLYYAQPLLHTIRGTFGVSNGTAGLLVTASQVGYAFGLAFLVPLGDLLERRRLIVVMLIVSGVGQAAASIAPGFGVFALALAVVGLTSAVAQIVVPMSSSLAAEHERGTVVGTVMSGLLIGVLTARTVSGIIAGLLGWRSVYVIAAALMFALAVVLRYALPRVRPTEDLPYRLAASLGAAPGARGAAAAPADGARRRRDGLLQRAVDLDRVPALRRAVSLRQHRDRPVRPRRTRRRPDRADHRAAGRPRARQAGHLGDAGRAAGQLGLLALGRHSIPALIAGIVALDLGVQGLQISNQSAIYSLRPEARSRLTTAYMVAYFVGGASLSAAAAALYGSDGWAGVCVLGAVTAAVALAVWVATERRSWAAARLGTVTGCG